MARYVKSRLDVCRIWPILIYMNRSNRSAIFALVAAGTLWGLNVPLSKLALAWLAPGWVTLLRFVVAAPLLALVGRRGLRDALDWQVLGRAPSGSAR